MRKIFFIVALLFAFAGFANAGININTATQSELETLQGIGPAKAKAIVEHRKENGPFVSKDSLADVNGIGPGTIKQLREDIVVNTAVVVGQKKQAAAK